MTRKFGVTVVLVDNYGILDVVHSDVLEYDVLRVASPALFVKGNLMRMYSLNVFCRSRLAYLPCLDPDTICCVLQYDIVHRHIGHTFLCVFSSQAANAAQHNN